MTNEIKNKFETMNMTIPQSARTKQSDNTLQSVPIKQFNMQMVNEKRKSANMYYNDKME